MLIVMGRVMVKVPGVLFTAVRVMEKLPGQFLGQCSSVVRQPFLKIFRQICHTLGVIAVVAIIEMIKNFIKTECEAPQHLLHVGVVEK